MVEVQLMDGFGKPFEISNVIITVHLFARRKNDFYLGPFVSDKSGKVKITQRELVNEIQATISTGIMDYSSAETCFPFIEIFVNPPEDIDRALNAREKHWNILLGGEKERWDSMEDLLNVYRHAKNKDVKISKELSRIRDEWDGERDEYHYSLSINKK